MSTAKSQPTISHGTRRILNAPKMVCTPINNVQGTLLMFGKCFANQISSDLWFCLSLSLESLPYSWDTQPSRAGSTKICQTKCLGAPKSSIWSLMKWLRIKSSGVLGSDRHSGVKPFYFAFVRSHTSIKLYECGSWMWLTELISFTPTTWSVTLSWYLCSWGFSLWSELYSTIISSQMYTQRNYAKAMGLQLDKDSLSKVFSKLSLRWLLVSWPLDLSCCLPT